MKKLFVPVSLVALIMAGCSVEPTESVPIADTASYYLGYVDYTTYTKETDIKIYFERKNDVDYSIVPVAVRIDGEKVAREEVVDLVRVTGDFYNGSIEIGGDNRRKGADYEINEGFEITLDIVPQDKNLKPERHTFGYVVK